MYYDKYCMADVTNVKSILENSGLRLLSNCVTPLIFGYCPGIGMTGEIKSDGFQ